MAGLMDLFGGGTADIYGDLISPEQRQALQQQAMLNTGLAILMGSTGQAGGPMPTFGQAVGGGYMAGQKGYQQGVENLIQGQLTKAKIDAMKREQALNAAIANGLVNMDGSGGNQPPAIMSPDASNAGEPAGASPASAPAAAPQMGTSQSRAAEAARLRQLGRMAIAAGKAEQGNALLAEAERIGPKLQVVNGRVIDVNDPALAGTVFPDIEFVNGIPVNKNAPNLQPVPKVGEGMIAVPGPNGYTVQAAPGAVQAAGDLAAATEGGKQQYNPVELKRPDGSTVTVTGAQVPQVLNNPQNAGQFGSPTPAKTAESTAMGDFFIKQVLTPAKQKADSARAENQSLIAIDSLLTRTQPDKISNTFQPLLQYAKAAGLVNAEGAKNITNIQSLRGLVSDAVLAQQLAQAGPQTESDARRMEMTLGSMDDANALKFLSSVKIARNNQAQDYYKFLNTYRSEKKTLDGAEQAWLEGKGKLSVFRDAKLKTYLPDFTDSKNAAANKQYLDDVKNGKRPAVAGIYQTPDGKKYRIYMDEGEPELVK